MVINLENLRELCKDDLIILTAHVRKRMKERNIKYDDIVHVIRTGEIIEQYEDNEPLPGALILGYINQSTPLHLVVNLDEKNGVWIITVYFPTLKRWEADYKIRKAVE
jgi:hypothetical protein